MQHPCCEYLQASNAIGMGKLTLPLMAGAQHHLLAQDVSVCTGFCAQVLGKVSDTAERTGVSAHLLISEHHKHVLELNVASSAFDSSDMPGEWYLLV